MSTEGLQTWRYLKNQRRYSDSLVLCLQWKKLTIFLFRYFLEAWPEVNPSKQWSLWGSDRTGCRHAVTGLWQAAETATFWLKNLVLAVEPDKCPLGAGPLSARLPVSVDAHHDRVAVQQQSRPAAAPSFNSVESEPNLWFHNEKALKLQNTSIADPDVVTHVRHTGLPCPRSQRTEHNHPAKSGRSLRSEDLEESRAAKERILI